VRIHIGLAALLFAVSGCGTSSSGDGGNGVAEVRPSQIGAEQLRAAASDPEVARFYEARDWQPAWNADSARAVVEAIGEGGRHGLDPQTFLAASERAVAPTDREVALTRAALDYARALARGRTDPARLFEVYESPRPDADVAAGLGQALHSETVGAWLAGLAPQDEEYRKLSEAYLAARAAGAQGTTPIAAGPDLRPGRADRRLGDIAAALRRAGYLASAGERAAPARHTPELVAAVRNLQQDYGLADDGIVDEQTLGALNDAAFDRVRTLAVNLERRRWRPRAQPGTRIDVNIAAATLDYWRDNRVADSRRVIVGEPGNETPQLDSPMFRLAANPTWTVPRSIQREEIEPKGAAYMARNNMEWRDDWIVQASGPTNSLGLVKFDLRNDHAIYLHDTPHKALFAQSLRHFSHGCVRVADALGFARMIAGEQGVGDQWERAQAEGEEGFVALPRPIPVRLYYQTAFLDNGRIRYRLDAYGWDETVARALGFAARPRREVAHREHDVGP